LVKAIDSDKNGVVTLREWRELLEPELTAERDFRAIMCNVDIDDPIDLEEKTLDLRYRAKHLEKELMLLRAKAGESRVRGTETKKKAMEQRLAGKLKQLESGIQTKQESNTEE
jgi:hypothetical protein